MAEKEEKDSKVFELVEVPTQHTTAISTPEGNVLTIEEGIVTILNEVVELRKQLG